MKKTINDLTILLNGELERVFNHFHDLYKDPLHVSSGCNGPHNDKVNNARVLSHLLITAYYLYKQTSKKRYIEWINRSIDEIFRCRDFHTQTYINRIEPGKDAYNGLIGQVWILQSLLYVHDLISMDQVNYGIQIPLQCHQYNIQSALWEYPVYTGDRVVYFPCYTLNQQIWFTAIVAEFNRIMKKDLFSMELKHISGNLNVVHDTWLVKQNLIQLKKINVSLVHHMSRKKIWTEMMNRICGRKKEIDLAYSPFTIWGWFYSDVFNEHAACSTIIELAEKHFYHNDIFKYSNQYMWGYNMSGIEIAMNFLHIKKQLTCKDEDTLSTLVHTNLQRPYRFTISDMVTFLARTYETIFLMEKLVPL